MLRSAIHHQDGKSCRAVTLEGLQSRNRYLLDIMNNMTQTERSASAFRQAVMVKSITASLYVLSSSFLTRSSLAFIQPHLNSFWTLLRPTLRHHSHRSLPLLWPRTQLMSSFAEVDQKSLGLTPRLVEVSQLFQLMDDRSRVQQLLQLAYNLKSLPDFRKLQDNKVPGCLSTVYIHAYLKDGKVYYEGDSDAQLTKGLVALLIDGLSGCSAQEIQAVKPEFIKAAGIAASLTPGRNNGFLNMLATMKRKALEAEEQGERQDDTAPVIDFREDVTRPLYSSMMKKLINYLKPAELQLDDESAQHAGHAGARGYDGESHFRLKIVADAFDGLSLVKRHKLIYTVLGQEMTQIHALSIDAKTVAEASAH